MPNDDEQSLTAALLRLTVQRDALVALVELTPNSHSERVREILAQVDAAIDDVTAALERWAVDWTW
jgi:hypothetical protein